VEALRTIVAADQDDPEDSDIYTHGPYQYPFADDAYFLFPMVYQHFRKEETTVGNDGVNDVQFMASRDGIHWMRYDRQPYLRKGLAGGPFGGGVNSMGYTIREGNYLHQYFSARPYTHGGFRRLSDADRTDRSKTWGHVKLYIATQRLDGYISADASFEGGWLVTPPITFQGRRLELNADVSALGVMRVGIEYANGSPVEGFGLEDCDRMFMNDVAHVVSWKRNTDLSALAGRPIRLRIEMTSARLFAFQFR